MDEELLRRINEALDGPDGLEGDVALQRELEAAPGAADHAREMAEIDRALRGWPTPGRSDDAWGASADAIDRALDREPAPDAHDFTDPPVFESAPSPVAPPIPIASAAAPRTPGRRGRGGAYLWAGLATAAGVGLVLAAGLGTLSDPGADEAVSVAPTPMGSAQGAPAPPELAAPSAPAYAAEGEGWLDEAEEAPRSDALGEDPAPQPPPGEALGYGGVGADRRTARPGATPRRPSGGMRSSSPRSAPHGPPDSWDPLADPAQGVPSGEILGAWLRVIEADALRCGAEGEHGWANVWITFARSGRVRRAVVRGRLAGTPTGACLVRAARKARLDPPVADGLTLTQPLRY